MVEAHASGRELCVQRNVTDGFLCRCEEPEGVAIGSLCNRQTVSVTLWAFDLKVQKKVQELEKEQARLLRNNHESRCLWYVLYGAE